MYKSQSFIIISLLFLLLIPSATAEMEKERKQQVWGFNPVEVFAPPTKSERERIYERLEVTRQQRRELEALLNKYEKDFEILIEDYKRAYNRLVEFIKAEKPPDARRVNNMLKEFHEVEEKILKKEVYYWKELKEILAPQQNYRLWELFEKDRLRVGR